MLRKIEFQPKNGFLIKKEHAYRKYYLLKSSDLKLEVLQALNVSVDCYIHGYLIILFFIYRTPNPNG